MKTALISLLLGFSHCTLFASGPAAPEAKMATKALDKRVAAAAAIAGAEFNRLRETKPEFQKAATVEAALDSLTSSQEPVHQALNREHLKANRAEVLALLIMQDGRLTGTPALNQAVAGTQTQTAGAKARRNAQSLVSVFCAAKAAGSPELANVQNADQAIAFVRTGVKGGGPFAKSVFQVELDDASLEAAMAFIEFDPNAASLVYNQDAVMPDEDTSVPAPPAPDAVAFAAVQLKQQVEMETKRKSP